MRYPRECFSINEDVTRNKKSEYERQLDLWYAKALQMYPNYFEMSLRERMNICDSISESVGFDVWR